MDLGDLLAVDIFFFTELLSVLPFMLVPKYKRLIPSHFHLIDWLFWSMLHSQAISIAWIN